MKIKIKFNKNNKNLEYLDHYEFDRNLSWSEKN